MTLEYIGIDLHKAFFQVCVLTPEGERMWEQRFPTTAAGIAAFLARCAGRESRVTVEATGPVWPFVDQVVGHVGLVVVVDPRKTKLKAGYAAKTDRLDARRLADALRRDSVVAVYYPPPAIRQLRELCRYRSSLVRVQVSVKQRVHALLLRQGVVAPAHSDLFGQAGQQWLTTVALEGWAADSLRGQLALGQAVQAFLTPVEAIVRREADHDPIVRALDQIPGLGPVLALLIRAELGTITRFRHPAQLASYAGLVPRVYQSGAHLRYGAITREGSPWLRWALVEAAVHGVQRPDAVGRWARQLAVRKGALIARVAVARRLCTEIFRVWWGLEQSTPSAVEKALTRTRLVS